MAYPTAVNSQITDAVTQANVKVIGEAPAMAMGSLYANLAPTIGNRLGQPQPVPDLPIAQAVMAQHISQLYSEPSTSDVPDTLSSLLSVLRALQP